MTTNFFIHGLLGLLPVSCFLAALMYLDSYKLVPIRLVIITIVLGCGSVVCHFRLDMRKLSRKWNIDFRRQFANELKRLQEMRCDGLLELTDDEIIAWKGKEIHILSNPWKWLE